MYKLAIVQMMRIAVPARSELAAIPSRKSRKHEELSKSSRSQHRTSGQLRLAPPVTQTPLNRISDNFDIKGMCASLTSGSTNTQSEGIGGKDRVELVELEDDDELYRDDGHDGDVDEEDWTDAGGRRLWKKPRHQ
jgi:hypothetical protein